MPIDDHVLAEVLVGAPDPELVALETRIRAAQLGGDVRALDALLSDDLLFTGPDGSIGTKEQDLAAHRSGNVRFIEHIPTELRLQRIGENVAIAALRATLTVDVGGTVVRGDYRYTRVWARADSAEWRVAGGHVSAVHAAT